MCNSKNQKQCRFLRKNISLPQDKALQTDHIQHKTINEAKNNYLNLHMEYIDCTPQMMTCRAYNILRIYKKN